MSVLNAQDPMYRKLVFRAAEPLSDHIKACLSFLTRISKIKVSGGSKTELVITVFLNPSADDPDSTAASFTITRTAKELETIQKAVHDHANLHKDLMAYDVPPCALCSQFDHMKPIRISTFQSLESVRASVVERLSFIIKGAVVPPTNEKLHCEGRDCIPSGLTKFLLRGVDQTKL